MEYTNQDISEETFNAIMEKLHETLVNYEVNFRELSFLKDEIENLRITNITKLEFLHRIIDWTYEVAPRSYVIRFIDYRLREDVNDAAAGEYDPRKFPSYLEFASNSGI